MNNYYLKECIVIFIESVSVFMNISNTLVNVYADLVVFTRIAGTS